MGSQHWGGFGPAQGAAVATDVCHVAGGKALVDFSSVGVPLCSGEFIAGCVPASWAVLEKPSFANVKVGLQAVTLAADSNVMADFSSFHYAVIPFYPREIRIGGEDPSEKRRRGAFLLLLLRLIQVRQ